MDELEIKENQYREYIDTHIMNVAKCFEIYGDKLCIALGLDRDELIDNVLEHDKSKYSNPEFHLYRQFFYPEDGKEKSKNLFDVGWLFHQNSNPHHPEFWVVRDNHDTKILNMPNLYIAEMLLDWAAMGLVFGNSAFEYYKEKGKEKPFSDKTRKIVDDIINIFK